MKTGGYVTQWGNFSAISAVLLPQGIAVDSSNNVYVTDYSSESRGEIQWQRRLYLQWGQALTAATGSSRILLASQWTAATTFMWSIQATSGSRRFDDNGNYLAQWGSFGTNIGQFYYPQGIAVDSGNSVYVTDTDNDRVERFNGNGGYIRQWGSLRSGIGQFRLDPEGIAVDRAGNYIYVAGYRQHAGLKFSSNDTNVIPPYYRAATHKPKTVPCWHECDP